MKHATRITGLLMLVTGCAGPGTTLPAYPLADPNLVRARDDAGTTGNGDADAEVIESTSPSVEPAEVRQERPRD